MDKNEIIEGIHTLVSNNVIGDKQLMSRYKGFRGELYFEEYLSDKYPNLEILEGGIIMSKGSVKSSLIDSIYYTIIPEEISLTNYVEVYSSLKYIGFQEMYVIRFLDNWEKMDVMIFKDDIISLNVPLFKIMRFENSTNQFLETGDEVELITNFLEDLPQRGRNRYPIDISCKKWLVDNLMQFDREKLLKIYMDRLFFDGFVGFSKNKGKCSDIDKIIKRPNGQIRLLEIKEKDLARSIKGFGMDVPRIRDLNKIQQLSKLEYHLVVRHIDNQTSRNLIGWKYISITDFINDVKDNRTIEGGTGMRSSYSSNPTLICSLNKFSNL